MNIYGANIVNNTASTLGGAIYVPNSTSAFLYVGEENPVADESVRFVGNVAEDSGGAVYAQHVAAFKNTEFINFCRNYCTPPLRCVGVRAAFSRKCGELFTFG
jgi:predicted outer membrane repeat protein